MEEDPNKRWRRFQRISFDKKSALKRAKRLQTVSMRHTHKFLLKRWNNLRDVRRIIIGWSLVIAALIVAVGVQLIWDQQNYQTTTGSIGGTYAEAAIGPIETLNPLYASTPAEEIISQLVFSRIATYDTTGNINYDLASSITTSKDGLAYTVKLKKGIKWHDGRDLTSEDVAFTVELIRNALTGSVIRGWESITVAALDADTVRFTLKEPYAPFIGALTFPVLPKHVLGEIEPAAIRENVFSSAPVGSGPFSVRLLQDLDTQNARRVVHLLANNSYYRGAPKLERFQVHSYATADDIVTALSLNEVNAAGGLQASQTSGLESRYDTISQPVQSGVYAFLNTTNEQLSDTRVRKALQYATNSIEIQEKVGGGVSSLSLPFTSLQLGSNAPKAPSFSAAEANRLLDEAGWVRQGNARIKDGQTLRLSVVTTKNSEYERALEVLIGQWRQVGVTIDERIIDTSDVTQNFIQTVLQPRNYDVLVYQIELGRDQDVYAYWHSSQASVRGLNLSNYKSGVADDILSSARTTRDESLREAKYNTFADRWLTDVPAVALYQPVTRYVYNKHVRGISANDVLVSPFSRYDTARLWTVGDRSVYKTP